MPEYEREELLVLVKTYPCPSQSYRETTCVAAVTRHGELRRLYPIPFRFLDGPQQFRKWEWISARVTRTSKDRRPESRRVDSDSIQSLGETIATRNNWSARMAHVLPHVVGSFAELQEQRAAHERSIGILRVSRLLGLEIEKETESEWTDRELSALRREGLFDTPEVGMRPILRKLPYRFYYRYEINTPFGTETNRHLITDWEIGQLYWHCWSDHHDAWEDAFRARAETEFSRKDMYLIMGTVHRFPDQWLITGLVYPPRSETSQLAMRI